MNEFLDVFILVCLMITAVAIIRVSNLFAVVSLAGFYSLLMASMFVVLDAVDVAFTEAAVGAGISTLIFLGTLLLTTRQAKTYRVSPLALVVCLAAGGLLLYGTQDMPVFGDPQAPVHQHVAPRYLNQSYGEIGVPNIVTSVLASYRGYDTMGEVVVVFAAGIGVLLLLYRGDEAEKEEG